MPGLQYLRRMGSVVVKLSCPDVCEIFPNQRSNLRALHRQADSYPLYQQRSAEILNTL